MTIHALIIEDDYDAAAIFSQALSTIGFEPEVISTGDGALVRLTQIEPYLILLDLHLPNVAGTEILSYIRKEERLQGTRVIIVTADPRMAETCEADADLVLLKPISFSQVRDLVSRFRPAQI